MAQAAGKSAATPSVGERIDRLGWTAAEQSLSERGYAITAPILSREECESVVALYNDASRFRSHIIMERYRFGIGDYKYFANPLPELVAELRSSAYPHLADVANQWAEAHGEKSLRYPREHTAFLKICHQAGQTKPTPLMLHYEAGGYNCLHQDLYGEVSFPLQMVFMLGQLGRVQAASGARGLRTSDYLHHALSAGKRFTRLLSRQSAARSEPRPRRYALHAGHHLPRRKMR